MQKRFEASTDSLNERDFSKTGDYRELSPAVMQKTVKVDRGRSSLSRSFNYSEIKPRVSTNVDARGRVFKPKLTESPSKTTSARFYVNQDTLASSTRKMERIQQISSVSASQAQAQINLRY